MKINLVVVFGGQSVEHDISIITALQVMANCNTTKYNVVPVYISKDGKWYSNEKMKDISFFQNDDNLKKLKQIYVLPNSNHIYKTGFFGLVKWHKIDAALLCLHGINGEDGTVPSIFQLSNTPYSSCNVFASAISCDKVAFKYYLKGKDIKTAKFADYSAFEHEKDSDLVVKSVINEIGFPCIVKPSKLGSSIGINVCKTKKELQNALALAFSLGEQALVEEYLENIKEVNCAAVGVFDDVLISELEEPLKNSDILSFENKYNNTAKIGNMHGLKRKMPPDITQENYDKIVEITKHLFLSLNLKGVVRIDFIIDKDNNVLVNEINTIPGSFAHYLFKSKKLTFDKLIDKIVNAAIYENAVMQQKIKTFESDILQNAKTGYGSKKTG